MLPRGRGRRASACHETRRDERGPLTKAARGGTWSPLVTGLGASISQAVGAGTYYLEVDGVGLADPNLGYSDYGSVGRYTVTVSAGDSPSPTPTVTATVTPTVAATGTLTPSHHRRP